MRIHFRSTARWLAVGVALSSLAGASCSDITAGQLTEDPAAPRLVRIIAGDEIPGLGTAFITDLLDTSKTYPPIKCDDTNPCPPQINGVAVTPFLATGDSGCTPPMGGTTDCALCGTCFDPLAAQPLEVGTPPGTPGTYGGVSIRLIFSKILDPSIETVTIDPATNAYTYTLAAGIIELDGPDGAVVPTVNFYDPSGSPDTTSDPLGNAGVLLGPSLVMKPMTPLNPKTQYTIKLATARVKDKTGKTPTDNASSPAPLADPYTFQFMTQDLSLSLAVPAPDMNGNLIMAPNDTFQIAASADLDPALNGTIVKGALAPKTPAKGAPASYDVEVWLDQGADPTMCSATPRLLDVAAVSTAGMPVDLVGCAAGAMADDTCTYTLTLPGIADASKSAKQDFTATVVVSNCDPTNMMQTCCDPKKPSPACGSSPATDSDDSAASGAMVFPEQCMAPPTDGGADQSAPADMAMTSDAAHAG